MHLSTAYHPQSDEQTEVVNRCLETYLRCMTADCPSKWFKCLSLAEWWYNTTFHSSIQRSPFEALYGYAPPIHITYIPGTTSNREDREAMIKLLRFHLHRAQHIKVQLANKKISEFVFHIGDWVYAKLQPYKQVSVEDRGNHKFSPLSYGPQKNLDKIRDVAYRLELPATSQIHPTFHVSKLKKTFGLEQVASASLPNCGNHAKVLECILARKMVTRQVATKVLVKWSNCFPEAATWEFLFDLQDKFQHFTLDDKCAAEGEVLMSKIEEEEKEATSATVGKRKEETELPLVGWNGQKTREKFVITGN